MKEEIIKELERRQNKKIRKIVILMAVVGIVLGGISGVAAYGISASQINYNPSDATWKVNNVSDAIDELKFKKVSNNYSTEEQVVGEWIDGKPIYQKTFPCASKIDIMLNKWTSLNSAFQIDANFVTNIDAILSYDLIRDQGYAYQGGSLLRNYPTAGVISILTPDTITVYTPNGSLTIQYTKTTDNPSS